MLRHLTAHAFMVGCSVLIASTLSADAREQPDRRAAGAVAASGPAAVATSAPAATRPATTRPASIHDLEVKDIDGQTRSLAEYRGKVVLVVNVASKCGFTPQYAGLQELYGKYKDRGLVVLGVPSNDFGRQEPGSEAEIKQFCATKFHTTFPMLSKVSVKNGPDQAPLYGYLTHKDQNGALDAKVSWNFNKFLVGRDGRVIRHYESKVKPEDARLKADIEAALGG